MHTWLITGCSSGLGRGIAKAAIERGENVAVTARTPEKLADLVGMAPDRVVALRLDLNDKESMKKAVARTQERFGGIDVLVNNAGHGYRAAIEESEDDKVAELFDTNFFAPMRLIDCVLPGMRAQRAGTIVNVTSVGAVRGALGNGYYSAAKGAFELASEALAKEVEHLGISVLIVEPGAMRTGFFDDHLGGTSNTIGDYDEIANKYRKEDAVSGHDQPGDPDRCGLAVVRTVLGDFGAMPVRLPLGSDCVAASKRTLTGRLAEVEKWAEVSSSCDFARKFV